MRTLRQQIEHLRNWLSEPQIEKPKPIEHHEVGFATFRFRDQESLQKIFGAGYAEGKRQRDEAQRAKEKGNAD